MNGPHVGIWCFACLPVRTRDAAHIKAARKRHCLARQAHRPGGSIVPHDHVDVPVRTCQDCGTLVADA